MSECCSAYSYHGSRTAGGMAEFVTTRAGNLVPLPSETDFETAALTEPAAVALHALNRGALRRGDGVAIVGAGTVGLLAAQIARARGAREVVLADVLEDKLEGGRRSGFGKVVQAEAPDAAEQIRRLAGGSGPDLVVEAAGWSASTNLAVDAAAPGGRVVLLGNIRDGNIRDDLRVPQKRENSILRKQLTLIGTWNSSLVNPENEWKAVHSMFVTGQVRVAPLISHRIALDDLPETLARVESGREPARKIVVKIAAP
jgi:L-iditol 2-dehydrogenase